MPKEAVTPPRTQRELEIYAERRIEQLLRRFPGLDRMLVVDMRVAAKELISRHGNTKVIDSVFDAFERCRSTAHLDFAFEAYDMARRLYLPEHSFRVLELIASVTDPHRSDMASIAELIFGWKDTGRALVHALERTLGVEGGSGQVPANIKDIRRELELDEGLGNVTVQEILALYASHGGSGQRVFQAVRDGTAASSILKSRRLAAAKRGI